VTEFLAECKRGTEPWKNMPRRMLRHKALIQCARVAFGFALYDDDEGSIAAGVMIDAATGEVIEPRGPRRKSEAAPAPATVIDGAPAEVAGEQTAAAAPVAAKAAAPAAPGTTGGISGGQVAYLRNKLKAAGLEESAHLRPLPGHEHRAAERRAVRRAQGRTSADGLTPWPRPSSPSTSRRTRTASWARSCLA
jgi:hypothetical protein